MNPVKNGLNWCCEKTGLSSRVLIWSLVAIGLMMVFTLLFTLPQTQRIKMLSAENAQIEAQLQETQLLMDMDRKLNAVLAQTYPDIERMNTEALDEDLLLELPSRFEELAAKQGVTLISIDSTSVDDGAQVEIDATFQGDIRLLYELLREVGRVRYVKRLTSMSILALPDAEQMKLKFTVPIK